MWVRLPANCLNAFLPKFQFTHPCGCDNGAAVKRQRGNSFNSRTRVGATGPLFHVITVNDVSIHAPVWVRPFDENNLTLYFKFQFTHPCGCDLFRPPLLSDACGFNSRTRVGATHNMYLICVSFNVSIHAPVWVRPRLRRRQGPSCRFQFTHPCGCDGRSGLSPEGTWSFNSRTRVGATRVLFCTVSCTSVSIHAPVWVRPIAQPPFLRASRFNSRTRVGATA